MNFLKFQQEIPPAFPTRGASGRMKIKAYQFTDRVEIKIDEFAQLIDAKNQSREGFV